jgi:phosphatidylserine/phosphatidylglycerophosphate/cardiolipin synthase-like enzyme
LWVAVFSFTHEAIAESLVAAAARGVDVAVVVETRQETPVMPRLLEGGVRVREDGNGSSMHHKFVVVDGDVVATGSFNWTNNADYNNDENLVILHSEGAAKQFAAEFLRVWDMGKEP